MGPFPNPQIPPASTRISVLAIIAAVMEEGATPTQEIVTAEGNVVRLGLEGSLQLFTIEGATFVLVTTGIGLANTASSLTAALSYVSPRYIFSCGSAGDLDTEVTVGEVTAFSNRIYGRVDIRELGYELGRVLGMPISYVADEDSLSHFITLPVQLGHTTARTGRFLPSDCLVSAELAVEFRKLFPSAIATGMGSATLAQIVAGVEVPFLTIHGISDLYGPETAANNYQRVPEASRLSFLVVLCLTELRKPEEVT